MWKFILALTVVTAVGGLIAAPKSTPEAKTLVGKLSDPDQKVRDEAAAALKDRRDALPWLRRATRSADKDTVRRASALLAPYEKERQKGVAKAIDACIRDGCVDLLTEWHQYWQPEKKDDLWMVGPRIAKPGMDLLAKTCRPIVWKMIERDLASLDEIDPKSCRSHDGPCPARFEHVDGTWTIRTDRLFHPPEFIRFASVADGGSLGSVRGGQFLILGSVGAHTLDQVFLACDGSASSWTINKKGGMTELGVTTASSVVVCRGNYICARIVGDCVLLVDGDIDLMGSEPRNSLIRATGEIRMPKRFSPENCTIQDHVKDATAPYKFFEPSDVGLSAVDDEEGFIVTGVKPGTSFGDCGIAKGDVIRAIDDAEVVGYEEFRKKLRRALVRQGDCIVTVVRDGKTLDLPVFFPMPK